MHNLARELRVTCQTEVNIPYFYINWVHESLSALCLKLGKSSVLHVRDKKCMQSLLSTKDQAHCKRLTICNLELQAWSWCITVIVLKTTWTWYIKFEAALQHQCITGLWLITAQNCLNAVRLGRCQYGHAVRLYIAWETIWGVSLISNLNFRTSM